MTFQPASGAKDLNPQQVESNQLLSKRLSSIYKLWGYEEVSPPRVERLSTLTAGGAIAIQDIVKLVANEPLGLRPEMTASIARAASTRLADRPRPLRLWAAGTVFESKQSVEGSIVIEEQLQSGVELLGIRETSAEIELLSLLLNALESLKLNKELRPTLLIGHTDLMDIILSPFQGDIREGIRNSLINFDRVYIESLKIDKSVKDSLLEIHETRGNPLDVLKIIEKYNNHEADISKLDELFKIIQEKSIDHNIDLQLDPTFQPHFELYTGLVFQIVCNGTSAPVVIARGGRYDDLVARCAASKQVSAGVGFSFSIDRIRELLSDSSVLNQSSDKVLIAYNNDNKFQLAADLQKSYHQKNRICLIELKPSSNRKEAEKIAERRGCSKLEWIE